GAAFDDRLCHLHDMQGRHHDAVRLQAIEDALEPCGDPVVEAGRCRDDAESAVPEIDEIARERESALAVVEADARMRILRVELVGIDVGKLARPQQLIDLGRVPMADQRDALDAVLDEGADLLRLLLFVIKAGGDQELVAGFLEPSLQRLDTSREDSDSERGHDVADDEGMARRQRTRGPIPHVAELAHRVHDALAKLRTHFFRMVEHARSRRGRDAGTPSYIPQGRHRIHYIGARLEWPE